MAWTNRNAFKTTCLSAAAGWMPSRKPVIWYAQGLSGAEPDAQGHAQVVAGSAVLVALVSPAYLASAWCRRELELFVRQTPQLEDGRLSRVINPPAPADTPPDAAARRHLMETVFPLAHHIAQALAALDTGPGTGAAAHPQPKPPA